MTRQPTFSRTSPGNGGDLRLPKTLRSAPPALPDHSLPKEVLLHRRYQELIRKHLGKVLDRLFAEFTGLNFHIAWAPLPLHQWDARSLPTTSGAGCRLRGSPLLPECRTCGPRQLTRALRTQGDGHHFTCRLGVRNYWYPIRVRGETLGLAYLQASSHSTARHFAGRPSARAGRLRGAQDNARAMSRLHFARAARFLRLVVQHLQTASLADLQKEDLGKVQQALRVFQKVQARLRKELNGILPAFRETPPVVQSESPPERIVRAVLERIHYDYAQRLTLQKCANDRRVNAAYLSHLFSHILGLSFKTCLTEVRVEEAKQLLGNSTQNISQVASAVGYASENRFRLAFRSVTGVSPRIWRETLQMNPSATRPST